MGRKKSICKENPEGFHCWHKHEHPIDKCCYCGYVPKKKKPTQTEEIIRLAKENKSFDEIQKGSGVKSSFRVENVIIRAKEDGTLPKDLVIEGFPDHEKERLELEAKRNAEKEERLLKQKEERLKLEEKRKVEKEEYLLKQQSEMNEYFKMEKEKMEIVCDNTEYCGHCFEHGIAGSPCLEWIQEEDGSYKFVINHKGKKRMKNIIFELSERTEKPPEPSYIDRTCLVGSDFVCYENENGWLILSYVGNWSDKYGIIADYIQKKIISGKVHIAISEGIWKKFNKLEDIKNEDNIIGSDEKIEIKGKLIRDNIGKISFIPNDDTNVKEWVSLRTEMLSKQESIHLKKLKSENDNTDEKV